MASIIGEELKKIVLAGIGATAVTVEKSQEILDELIQKGEITVEQGKTMNEELKHNIKKTFSSESKEINVDELDNMSKEELDSLRAKLAELDSAMATDAKKDETKK